MATKKTTEKKLDSTSSLAKAAADAHNRYEACRRDYRTKKRAAEMAEERFLKASAAVLAASDAVDKEAAMEAFISRTKDRVS
jgi:hypothetical protein